MSYLLHTGRRAILGTWDRAAVSPVPLWLGALVSLIAGPILLSVAGNYTTRLIDVLSPRAATALRSFFQWHYGPTSIAILIGCIAVTILFLWSRSDPAIAAQESTAKARRHSTAADKGLLDFQIESEEAIKQFQRLNNSVAYRTGQVARSSDRAVKSWNSAGEDARARRRVLKTFAWQSDRYSGFLEKQESKLRHTIDVITESFIGIIQHAAMRDELELRARRAAVWTLKGKIVESQASLSSFRDSVRVVREENMSQDANRAADRMVKAIEKIISLWRDFDGRCDEMIAAIDTKLASAASESAQHI